MDRSVLIAEEKAGIRLLLLEVFESEGYNVTTATNKKEVLDELKQSHYDVLIIEQNLLTRYDMSIMDIIEKDINQLDVIVINDMVYQSTSFELKHQSIKAVVEKPFNIQELLDLVKNI